MTAVWSRSIMAVLNLFPKTNSLMRGLTDVAVWPRCTRAWNRSSTVKSLCTQKKSRVSSGDNDVVMEEVRATASDASVCLCLSQHDHVAAVGGRVRLVADARDDDRRRRPQSILETN
jgi:hypothetical protein